MASVARAEDLTAKLNAIQFANDIGKQLRNS